MSAAFLAVIHVGAILVVEETQLLYDALRYVGEAGAVVDRDDVHAGRLLRFVHALRHLEGLLPLLDRQRLQVVHGVVSGDEKRILVVEHVHVRDEEVLGQGVVLQCHEGAFVRKRIRMEEELARVIHETIRRDVLHRLAPPRQLLHRAGRLASALRDVEEHELALAAHAVVAGDDGHELGGRSRNGLRVEHGVGPVGVGAVVLLLVAAVRVHGHQDAREIVRGVGVFPAQVEAAPVGKHHGMPVVVLVERETAEASVRVAEHEVAHVVGAAHAGHALEADGSHQEHLAVGEVHGIVVVDVGRVGGRDLAETSGRGEVHLRHAPSAFANAAVRAVAGSATARGGLSQLAGGEGDLRQIPVKRHVADERVAFVERAFGGGAVFREGHAHEGVRVAAHGHARVALPVLGQAQRVAVAAADREEIGETAEGRQTQKDLL